MGRRLIQINSYVDDMAEYNNDSAKIKKKQQAKKHVKTKKNHGIDRLCLKCWRGMTKNLKFTNKELKRKKERKRKENNP